jgi:hypothetical protein
MNRKEERKRFEEKFVNRESAILKFYGVDGYDVYNCSVPFTWGKRRYIFGRVERRSEWMRSFVRLFEECGKDEWSLVPDSMIYQLEDPYISKVQGELVLGGTHVKVKAGRLDTYYGYFYKGVDISDLYYFTSGPDDMKDIRLVELADGKIGVFSRPRNEEIRKSYGCESMIGFAVIDSLKELTEDVIENAPYVEGLFVPDEWGGCNQAYLLESGKVGVIGHISYRNRMDGREISSYMNMSFVLDPMTRETQDFKIIGTRNCYPDGPAKMPNLTDCAFTSGIVMRPDGRADLYSGIGDCQEGRVVIPYPFEKYGAIVRK